MRQPNDTMIRCLDGDDGGGREVDDNAMDLDD